MHSGLVYDATPFLAEHPGGAESILIVAGQVLQGGPHWIELFGGYWGGWLPRLLSGAACYECRQLRRKCVLLICKLEPPSEWTSFHKTVWCALQEATDEFDAIHSAKAKGMLKKYLIGRVGEAPPQEPGLPAPQEKAEVRAGWYGGFEVCWFSLMHGGCTAHEAVPHDASTHMCKWGVDSSERVPA